MDQQIPEDGPVSDGPRRTPWLHIACAAVLLTALNAVKPVHMDDSVYLMYGAEFVAHPLDPYAFQFGSPTTGPANDLLVPPVLPYWLGLGTTLFGDHIVLIKCWLLPFALLLAWALDFLAARLAGRLRLPLLWLGLISPTFLPGFNCMLEVPVFALGLAALAVAIRSLERDSWSQTLLAGVLAGLAVQTKYTGIIACAAIVAWCVLHKHWVRGLAVAAVALTLAVGWEFWLASVQGQSHFVVQLHQRQGHALQRCLRLVLPLISHVAGLAPVLALLGLRALGWTGRGIRTVTLAMLAMAALLAVIPSQAALLTGANGKALLTPSNLVYALLALPVWAALGAVCLRLVWGRDVEGTDRSLDWFLLVWLALELGGYFALSPFPAARRVTGLLLVLTFLMGRLAHLRGVSSRMVGRLAVGGAALAALFFVTDLLEARAEKRAAYHVARGTYYPAAGGTFWHLDWAGFGYYATREAMRPLQLNQQLPHPGDLLALPDLPGAREALAQHGEIGLELIDTVVAGDRFPLQVMPGYYGGRTPVENQRGARFHVLV
jgi:hypothetical protein